MFVKSSGKFLGCMKLNTAGYVIGGVGMPISALIVLFGFSMLDSEGCSFSDDSYCINMQLIHEDEGVCTIFIGCVVALAHALLLIGVYKQRTSFLRLWQVVASFSLVPWCLVFSDNLSNRYHGQTVMVLYFIMLTHHCLSCIHTMCNQIQENYYRAKFNVPNTELVDAVESQSNDKSILIENEQQCKIWLPEK